MALLETKIQIYLARATNYIIKIPKNQIETQKKFK